MWEIRSSANKSLWNYVLSRILLPLDFAVGAGGQDFPVGMRLCFTLGDAARKVGKDWSFSFKPLKFPILGCLVSSFFGKFLVG